MSSLDFSPSWTFNHVFLLESLDENESHTGTRLALDTFIPLRSRYGIGISAYGVKTKALFLEMLDKITEKCSSGTVYPILHLDIHGSAGGDGLVISPSGELVTWAEFAEKCRNINRACKNNLVVIMAVCSGYRAILGADIKDVTPFFILIGPERTVTNGFIMTQFPKFYEELLRTKNVNAAMALISAEYQIYLSELIFFKVFYKYSKEQCTGEGEIHRIDELTEKIRYRNGVSDIDIGKIKEQLKMMIKPNEATFNKYKRQFLLSDLPENAERFQATFNNLLDILND